MRIKKLSALILAGVLSCTAPAAVYAGDDTVDTAVDAAVDILKDSEIDSLLSDPDKVVDIIMYVKESIGNQDVSDEDIMQVIGLAEESLQVQISDSDKETLIKIFRKFQDMDLDEEQLKSQVHKIYDKLESLGITSDDVKGFVEKTIDFVKSLLN